MSEAAGKGACTGGQGPVDGEPMLQLAVALEIYSPQSVILSG